MSFTEMQVLIKLQIIPPPSFIFMLLSIPFPSLFMFFPHILPHRLDYRSTNNHTDLAVRWWRTVPPSPPRPGRERRRCTGSGATGTPSQLYQTPFKQNISSSHAAYNKNFQKYRFDPLVVYLWDPFQVYTLTMIHPQCREASKRHWNHQYVLMFVFFNLYLFIQFKTLPQINRSIYILYISAVALLKYFAG